MDTTATTLDVLGRRFGYQALGEASDVAVFVHGSGFTGAMWLPFARSLAPRVRSVMVDLLGHGSSEPIGPKERVDSAPDEAMIAEIMTREAGILGRVHLVGHSYGAVLAARVALARPDLLRSLVLIEPVLFGPLLCERPADCVSELDHLFADGRLLDEDTRGSEEWVRRFYDYWTGPGAWALLTERQRELQMEASHKSFCEVKDAVADVRPFSAYARLPKPLVLVGGERSTKSAARILSRLGEAAGAMVHVVPGATHFVPITHGPELMEIMLRVWAIPQASVSKAHVGQP